MIGHNTLAEARHLEWRRSLGQDVTEITISEAMKIWGVKYESARQRLRVLGIKVNKKRRKLPPREQVEVAFANYATAFDAAETLGVGIDTAMRYADYYGIPRRKNKKRTK